MIAMERKNRHMSSPGLRELKKQKTRWAIQEHALRLIAQQGYESTTVEQIAAAAEISPSTFFRYFPTKEDVVIQDEYDPMIMAAFEAEPPGEGPITAFRLAMRKVLAGVDDSERRQVFERTKLIMSVPALRARTYEGLTGMMGLVAEHVARRARRDPDDLQVRVVAGACVGALLAAVFAWIEADGRPDFGDLVDSSLQLLEGGPLNAP
jgi:AcrR family transcriptional regulator